MDYAKMNADACSNAMGINACTNGIGPSASAPSITFGGVDPCFVAQNAMRPCYSAPQAPPAQLIGVDPHLLGTWYLPLGKGFWVFEFLANGTYLLQAPDVWIATGRLGTGAWRHNSLNVVLSR